MVRQRGDSWQVDLYYKLDGKAKRFRKDCGSKLEAEQLENRVKGRLLTGQTPKETSTGGDTCRNMKQLYDATYARRWAGTKSERTHCVNAMTCVKGIGPEVHPSKVTEATVDMLVKQWSEAGNSGGTINRKLSSLSVMLDHAKTRGWIDRVPSMERRSESEHRIRWYTPQEEAKIIGYFDRMGMTEMSDLVTLLVDTGLRVGEEAIPLLWKDTQDGYVRLWDTKNGKGRAVPQSTRVRLMLTRRAKECPAGEERVFWNIESYSGARHRWDRMKDTLGYSHDDQFIMHSCRHTFVSRLVQKNVPLIDVKALAGHGSLNVTQRYAHANPANLRAAIEAMEGKPVGEPVPTMRIAAG
jgi:site-specific recombinase XerD